MARLLCACGLVALWSLAARAQHFDSSRLRTVFRLKNNQSLTAADQHVPHVTDAPRRPHAVMNRQRYQRRRQRTTATTPTTTSTTTTTTTALPDKDQEYYEYDDYYDDYEDYKLTTTTTTTTTTVAPKRRRGRRRFRRPTTEPTTTTTTTTLSPGYKPRPDGRVIDYMADPNFPFELRGADLTEYPFFVSIPDSRFECKGRHDGYYADIELKCQVYHHCAVGHQRYDFLCPNYTLFDQTTFTCRFVNTVDCLNSEEHYSRNNELYVETTTASSASSLSSGNATAH